MLRGENSRSTGGTPNTLLTSQDINVCSARPDGQIKISMDLKLPTKVEKSVQQAAKSQVGNVGQIRKLAVVVKCELIFREMLLI